MLFYLSPGTSSPTTAANINAVLRAEKNTTGT